MTPAIKALAKKHTIPTTTLWKRVRNVVRGTGYRSGGGRRTPRVLGAGKYFFGICVCVCVCLFSLVYP